MPCPDFFIIGAPKSGTTALSEYLRTHPGICFSATKEPHFFADDLPRHKLDSDIDAYWRRNFGHCGAHQGQLTGEGSALYYLSGVAIGNILKIRPDAKFVFMIRNPVDLVTSYFHQQRFDGNEDAEKVGAAWQLQAARARGESIPRGCNEPKLLQYRALASLGSSLERLRAQIPLAQLHVILLDDMIANPKKVYEDCLDFLGLAPDGRDNFGAVNEQKEWRNPWIGRLSASIPPWLHNIVRDIKARLGLGHVPLNVLIRLNARKATRTPLDAETRREIGTAFEPEIAMLERLLARDLSAWRRSGFQDRVDKDR